MTMREVSVSNLKRDGWTFIGNSWFIAQIGNCYTAANSYVEEDVELTDYFEDWENPTETEMSLFDLERGYRLEFV